MSPWESSTTERHNLSRGLGCPKRRLLTVDNLVYDSCPQEAVAKVKAFLHSDGMTNASLEISAAIRSSLLF
ncbi:hypothetical protein ACHAXR_013112 [Thalassiosira sp. AJA248-18]